MPGMPALTDMPRSTALRHATAPRRLTGLLLATPALLALLLAAILPQQRLAWLALLLFAALFASLAASLWPYSQPSVHPPDAVARRRRLVLTTLLFLAMPLAPLLPLPLGLLLLLAARQGLLLIRRPVPGFPLLDTVLLVAAVLALLPPHG